MTTAPRRRSGWSRSLLAAGNTLAVAVAAIAITLVLTAGPILIAGANPIEAYVQFFITPLTSEFRFLEVLVSATPLVFA